jgi:hypothetical protein
VAFALNVYTNTSRESRRVHNDKYQKKRELSKPKKEKKNRLSG